MCSVAATSHSSPSVSTDVTPKRRKTQANEEKRQHLEQEASPYDPTPPLCATIYVDLLEGRDPQYVANQIVINSPDSLLSLASLSPQRVVKLVQDHIALSGYEINQQETILKTVLILYLTSLVNSSTGECAKRFESSEHSARRNGVKSELCVMIELSEQDHAAVLIKKAEEVLRASVKSNEREVQKQIRAINQITDDVNKFLDLFFYHTPSNRERFEKLFIYSDQFPKCGKPFSLLMQNLDICQQEYRELVCLRKNLYNQTMELQLKIKSFQDPRVQKLPKACEQMLEYQADLLWEAGVELLEQGLKNVFLGKKDSRISIPGPFKNAIKTASQPQEFRQFNFKALLANQTHQLPPQFVSAVWDHYRGEKSRIVDISDLMRHIIGKLPEPFFKQLETDLKTSLDKKKTLMTALHQYFRVQFRELSFTLTALKDWLET